MPTTNPPPPPVQVLTAGGAAKIKDASNSTAKSRRSRSKKQQQTAPFDAPAPDRENEHAIAALHNASRINNSSSTTNEAMPPVNNNDNNDSSYKKQADSSSSLKSESFMTASLPEPNPEELHSPSSSSHQAQNSQRSTDLAWLLLCFLGIMASFVCYGLLLEYTTSGGRQLHELSFLFVTSSLYTITAAAGRYVRDETPTTIPPARFAILGLTSMGSTFCSVRSLRYVIYPIQVLAKSCKPVPVMIMGAFMGKKYPLRKYINVCLIVLGVALFMGGGDNKKKGASSSSNDDGSSSSPSQIFGILLLFVSLCFDGGTGAYEDKLMSVHSVQPFDLMYNIQLGKTILAGVGLLVLNQVHVFLAMIQDMGFLLLLLGLSGAMGQVFIFVTISKFGALTCSIIGLARKVTTLVASIYFYGHHLNAIQFSGLLLSIFSMVMNFWGKKSKAPTTTSSLPNHPQDDDGNDEVTEEMVHLIHFTDQDAREDGELEKAGPDASGDVELSAVKKKEASAIV